MATYVAERQNGRMAYWQNGLLSERGGTAERQNGGTVEWWSVWIRTKSTRYIYGTHTLAAEWRTGGTAERRNGYVPNLHDIFTVHMDDDDIDTLIIYSIED